MQTFLPYPDIIKSVQCLDDKRLGCQRKEAYQILRALSGLTKGWRQHPAVKMWRGYEPLLSYYLNDCITEWKFRGFKNNMLYCAWWQSRYMTLTQILNEYDKYLENLPKPKWWGNKQFHDSHKSNLLRKYPEYYSKFNWNVGPNLPYYWPI